MEWIDINVEQPKRGLRVLVTFNKKGFHGDKIKQDIEKAYRMINGDNWIIGNQFGFEMGEVTHWMPLPSLPPKNE